MLRLMRRLGLFTLSVCVALAFGAGAVGGLLPTQQLIFTSQSIGSFERYITIADVGHGLHLPITFHQYGGFALSQRGELAFTIDNTSILAVNVYNYEWHGLTQNLSYTGIFHAVWSPDSSILAFVAADESRYRLSQRIYLSDGVTVRNLMPEHSFRLIREIAWSPDGTSIAFAGYENNSSGSDIYLLTLSSGELVNLSPDDMNGTHPTWSPDGTRLAFASSLNSIIDIYVLNLDDYSLQNLTENVENATFPAWSPDGTQIVYVMVGTLRSTVFSIDGAGENGRQLAEFSGRINSVNWSPDGMWLAVDTAQTNSDPQIYIIDVESGDLRRVSYKGYADALPVWLP